METAARLLRRSDWNIQQIITYVGYENTSYFYRLFHERYGQSPREVPPEPRGPHPHTGLTFEHREKDVPCLRDVFDVLRWKNDAECVTIKARPAKMWGAAGAGRRRWKQVFRGARRSDLEQILEIYAHARKEMADSGNPTQWGDSYPPQEMLEEASTPTGCSSIW